MSLTEVGRPANASPVLEPDGPGELAWARDRFQEEGRGLDPELRELVALSLDRSEAA